MSSKTVSLSVDFGVVLYTPDLEMQAALNAAIAAVSNLNLLGTRDSVSGARSIYAPTIGRVVINTPALHIFEVLGPRGVVCAFGVKGKPSTAADIFAQTIERHGLRAVSHHKVEPEIPILSFVTIEAMPFVAFVMWPN